MLMTYSHEYGLDKEQLNLMRTDYKQIQNLIITLKDTQLNIQKKNEYQIELKKKYQDIINGIFKKIYYDNKIDSIQKIEPLLPKDSKFEFFGEVLYIINSFINSLYLLREKIAQSIILIDNEFFINNSVVDYSNILHHMIIDYKQITKLLNPES